MRNLTVSLLQADLHWQDPEKNQALFAKLAKQVPAQTQLLVLPEMFNTGFTMDTRAVAQPMDGPSIEWMRELARQHQLTVTGSLVIEDGGRFFNRLIWVPPSGDISSYDKRHLFRMAGEQEHFSAGSHRQIFYLDDWRICPMVCYDLRFPVWSRGINEFDLLLYVANWPAARRSAWQSLLPARAVENLCYCAGLNRVGTDGKGIEYAGDSGAWDYLGNAIADGGSKPEVITVEFNGARLTRYREKFPAHLDADSFSLRTDEAEI
ncbi:MAG: amidohydrolase [Gammaproteobacteria bacterium]